MKIFFAYLFLFIANIILLIFSLRIFGYIDFGYIDAKILIFLFILPLSLIYHKYKPMTFKEVIVKFIGVKLPSWDMIKYKLMILIGTDSNSLKKPKE